MDSSILTILTLIKALVFAGYVSYIYRRFGVLQSISASSYYLQGQQRWYFFGFLAILALLNVPQLGVWGVLSSAGLAFSGITIDHRSDIANSRVVHTVGTVAGIVFAFVGLAVLHGIWWTIPVFILSVAVIRFFTEKYFIWYLEIAAMIVVILGYLAR